MNVITSLPATSGVTPHEHQDIARVNASGLQPVVFVHGLWLLSNSWDRWIKVFADAGYSAMAADWPDDPESTAEANAYPDVFADKSIGMIAAHLETVLQGLDRKPAVIGHSFGGMLAEVLAGKGLSAATVAISPAGFRGVLPLPFSALRSAWPGLRNPANRHRAVALSFDQFRYGFANAVGEDQARQLYEQFAVPGSGEPLFQEAEANLNPWSEVMVDTKNAARGPLLIVAAEDDHTVTTAVARAAFKLQQANVGLTEYVELKDVGHALTIDNRWRNVADTALSFVQRFV
jgi:pimeloyl-ACP methyl ester carboxylesterase